MPLLVVEQNSQKEGNAVDLRPEWVSVLGQRSVDENSHLLVLLLDDRDTKDTRNSFIVLNFHQMFGIKLFEQIILFELNKSILLFDRYIDEQSFIIIDRSPLNNRLVDKISPRFKVWMEVLHPRMLWINNICRLIGRDKFFRWRNQRQMLNDCCCDRLTSRVRTILPTSQSLGQSYPSFVGKIERESKFLHNFYDKSIRIDHFSDFNQQLLKILQKQMASLKAQFLDPNSKTRCGLFQRLPSGKGKMKQLFLVPLRSCSYDLEIVNSLVNVTLTQTYINPTDKFLEVDYCFPINPNSCIYKFVATFGNNRIEGIVKQKEQANKEYEQAIEAGKQAALGELNEESKDIMILKIGNIAPEQEVRIEISYMKELTLSYNMFYQLRFPGTISPRYLNHIPKEKILMGYKRQGFNEKPSIQVKGSFTWTFKITLKTSRKVIFFKSHTHDIELVSQNDSATESIFVLEKACLPNKDFALAYTTEEYQLPNYVFGRTDHSSSVMLSFIPKFCSLSINDAYAASLKDTPFQTDIQSAKGQYIFLLDRSGSMDGRRINKAKQALILFIKSLPQDTYFNVISFGSGYKKLFPESRRYDDKAVTEAVNSIKMMTADMGGTEIYSALEMLLVTAAIQEGYPKQIFLLTDGGVEMTNQVVNMVGIHSKYARVHTIGIGYGASQELIIGCAKSGKGYHTFIDDSEDPSDKIIQLLTDSLSAVISEIKLDYDPNLIQSIIPNPKSIPFILRGEIVNFFITFKGQLEQKASFEFSYIDSHNKMKYHSDISIDPESNNEAFIDKMAHFKRIRLFEESYRRGVGVEYHMFFAKKIDNKTEAIKESIENQILSQFTAFLCVEKELIDGKYEQIKGKGQISVAVNNPEPIEYTQSLYESKEGYKGSRQVKGRSSNVSQGGMMKSLKMSSPLEQNRRKLEEMKQKRTYRIIKNTKQMLQIPQKQSKEQTNKYMKMLNSPSGNFLKKSEQMISKVEQKEAGCSDKNTQIGIIPKEKLKINQIIAYQTTEGSWTEINLIVNLFGKTVSEIIEKQAYPIAVISYLVAKWIQKHHPQKKYELIIKKAMNFIKKTAPNHEQFNALYKKYIL